ncbi:spore gernimation protein GerPD [Aquibacillus koreensis]|uniref:Spore gernimation protein GerPD n=1 Tax=Aquibacillus koreensis TaxID=279446 RepID=A0A9X3WHZ1_9BACI|nr:spore gernimation protein GerPD [Aquibacillus koreensis]MCT2535608.1 spore gernimation protein GerPD [Aquibacillus koreensis]MDC3420107.1 spore gernimation protein GerPD [Aquibacillus koreensis]
MKHEVHNWDVHVGNIEVTGVTASSVFLIGDNETIKLSSFYDTPPDSYIVGSLVPLSRPMQPEGNTDE